MPFYYLKNLAAKPSINSFYLLMNNFILQALDLSGNKLSGEIVPLAFCATPYDWDLDGSDSTKSYIDDNNFCPGTEGYPSCIEPYIGEQNIDACISP